MKNSSVFSVVLGSLVLVAGIRPLCATQIQVSCSQSTTMTLTKASPVTTGIITCPDFNPALGTLTGAVYFTPSGMTYLAGSSFTLTNPTATAITFPSKLIAANFAFSFGAFPDGQTLLGSTPLSSNAEPTLFSSGGSVLFVPQSSTPFVGSGFLVMNSSALPVITGNGTFILPVSVKASDIVASQAESPLELADFAANFYLDATPPPGQSGYLGSNVLYTYTPNLAATPEPSAIAIAATSLALVFTIRQRKICR